MKESKREQSSTSRKSKSVHPGSSGMISSQQPSSIPEEVRTPSAERVEHEMELDNARMERDATLRKLNSVLMLPSIGRGNSRPSFPLELSPSTTAVAQIILTVTCFVMSFVVGGTAAMANALNGCFLEDLRAAVSGKRSLFQAAPRVWWEIRFALTPCYSGSFSFNYSVPPSSIAYAPATGFVLLGDQPTLLVDLNSNVGASAITTYANLDVSNADYEIASDCFAFAGEGLKMMANPFENRINRDPSAFSSQVFNLSATTGFGWCASGINTPIDYNRYCNVKPKDRFNASLCLNQVQTSTNQAPRRYSIMTASMPEEIGHRLFCDFIGADETIRNYMPCGVKIRAADIIYRAMWFFNNTLLEFGVAPGSVTETGSQNMAAYFFLAICEWFAPWSMVAYFRGKTDSLFTKYYTATSGCMIQNLWKSCPLPAPLAIQLTHLTPYVDPQLKRVYYPILDVYALEDLTLYTQPNFLVFATSNMGVAPWTSLVGTNWCALFDTNKTIANVLSKFSNYIPLRSFPHTSRVLSLACHVELNWNGTQPHVICSNMFPTDEERELFTLFVLPEYFSSTNERFFEYVRFFNGREMTVLPDAHNAAQWQSFVIVNNNPVSTAAKAFLDNYDKTQEEESYYSGWITSPLGVASMSALGWNSLGVDASIFAKKS
jgi:hypothetical protein